MKLSINIKYDSKNTGLIDDYYATGSHSDIINGVLKGTLNKSSISSHIAYGPYGSGKSYVSALINGIVSKEYNKSNIKKLSKKYSLVNKDIESVIENSSNNEITYIPVLMSGFEGEFLPALIKTIKRALKENNNTKNIKISDEYSEIRKIIDLWKNDNTKIFEIFTNFLKEENININEYITKTKAFNDLTLNLFNIFTNKYFGVDFDNINSNDDFSILENILHKLEKKKIGLNIIHDEFGRMLQKINKNNINQFMQNFQDLAELANNGSCNLSLLFIAHKRVSHYFDFSDQDLRKEFSKIEKRFNTYEIKSEYSTYLKVLESVIGTLNVDEISEETLDQMIIDSRSYSFFSNSLSNTEVDNVIIKKLYPLHPMTTFILPRISSIFGQNERTLFTFINDSSTSSLNNFLKTNSGRYYTPEMLTDYFIDKLDVETFNDDIILKLYKRNLNIINEKNIKKEYLDNSIKIYKFISLWGMISGNSYNKIDANLISYSLNINVNDVSIVLEKLEELKIVRYNHIYEYFEVFEGSSLNIEKEIKKIISETKFKKQDLIKVLNDNNKNRYVYSTKHNANNYISRFAVLNFSLNEVLLEREKCDLFLDIPLDYISDTNNIINHNFNFTKIENTLKKIYIINGMVDNKFYEINYPKSGIELEFELSKELSKLNTFYKNIFKESLFNIYENSFKIKSREELDTKLSEIFDKKFNESPLIVNDQINMYQLTTQQRKAVIDVLDNILYNNDKLDETFSGSKPSDLIYYNCIKNITGEGSTNNIKYLDNIKKDILEYINSNQKGKFSNLYKILIKKPYGIRPPVAILILFNILTDKFDDIMLFRNENFIPKISSEELYDEIINDNDLSYVYRKYDSENKENLLKLKDIFAEYDSELGTKTLSIKVCSLVYNWVVQLPVITQQYLYMSNENKEFLKIATKTRINPNEAINKILNYKDINTIIKNKKEIEESFSIYLDTFESDVLKECNITDRKTTISKYLDEGYKNYTFIKGLKSPNIIEFYRNEMMEVELKKWTKSSFEALKTIMIKDFSNLSENINYDFVVINGKEKKIQDVKLTAKASNLQKNINNLIKATKKYLNQE